jgi:hypothetical protein
MADQIRTSIARVYYGAGRKRYFTAAGAAKSIAAKAFIAKYGCECETTMAEGGEWCDTHKIIKQGPGMWHHPMGEPFRRYVRMLRYLLRKDSKRWQIKTS